MDDDDAVTGFDEILLLPVSDGGLNPVVQVLLPTLVPGRSKRMGGREGGKDGSTNTKAFSPEYLHYQHSTAAVSAI